MDFGITMFCTDEAIRPDELARACEDRGFESLFVPEHTHIPASRTSPFPGGGDLPREYTRTLDPFVALTAAASVTSRLVLGFGICLLIQRDPIATAKAVASLDYLSGGRVLFGVGAGWNREEMANHGTDPATRFDVLGERVRAVRTLWTEDEASFHGEHVAFDRVWSWPKPITTPHPPVLVGGGGPTVLDRVLEYGDGWMPIGRREPEAIGGRVAELSQRAAAAGREPPPVTVFGARPREETIEAYAAMGVARCLLPLPAAGVEEVLPRLDRYAGLVERYADA